MRILANPVLLRAALVFFCAGAAFLLALMVMRLLRKNISEEATISSETAPSLETLPLHLYNTVIQQLKQQKHELQVQSRAEQMRARTTETLSQAVLTNLSCGVLVFGMNGLVKTSNPAAKAILGFASPTGMGARDLFRGAVISSDGKAASDASADEANLGRSPESVGVADELDAVLRDGGNRRHIHAVYETPSGERRFLAIALSPVPASDGGLLGVTCLIHDLSELNRIRRQQELQGELSAEMALALRTSLTAISGYAQQLASSRDPELAKQLASDIADEAAHLDRSLGGFLTSKQTAQRAAVGSSVE